MRIVLIDIDSLRPDHLGTYGYERNTSPTIDNLANDGICFDQCYVSDAPCLPSRTALATCRFGIKTGVVTHHGSGQWYQEPGEGHSQDPDRPLAFRLLSEAGIHTTTVTSFDKRHLAYHFTSGFREAIQPATETGGEDDEEVTEVAVDWLKKHAHKDDWLLHVNYWGVHFPYHGMKEFVEDVQESGPYPSWPDQDAIDSHQEMTGTRTADLWPDPRHYPDGFKEGRYSEWPMPESIEGREQLEYIVDGYDASIRKVDSEIQVLLDTLEQHSVREETTVIITADHGDALGEHGLYATHQMPHPPCQQVPMIISSPELSDQIRGDAVETQIYQFDLLPTLCELNGIEIPKQWDAKPFTQRLYSEDFDGREYLVSGHGIYTFGRAVYKDPWVYIRLLHPGVSSLPGLYNDPDLPNQGLELLHNREEDPHMTENVISTHSEKADELRSDLSVWTTEMIASDDAEGSDPLLHMAITDAPTCYVTPEELLDLYSELGGRTEQQIETVKKSI